jgi:hypothetical protein
MRLNIQTNSTLLSSGIILEIKNIIFKDMIRFITANFKLKHMKIVTKNLELKLKIKNSKLFEKVRPPLWSSGQSSWLQIRRPGFDSRHYQIQVVGLERGSLSFVSTTEELLDRKVAAPV